MNSNLKGNWRRNFSRISDWMETIKEWLCIYVLRTNEPDISRGHIFITSRRIHVEDYHRKTTPLMEHHLYASPREHIQTSCNPFPSLILFFSLLLFAVSTKGFFPVIRKRPSVGEKDTKPNWDCCVHLNFLHSLYHKDLASCCTIFVTERHDHS